MGDSAAGLSLLIAGVEEQDIAKVKSLLEHSLVPDTETVTMAREELTPFLAQPTSVPVLIYLAIVAENPGVRLGFVSSIKSTYYCFTLLNWASMGICTTSLHAIRV
jgi:hypothetical protein